jgi:hypothetical protein
MVIPNFFFPCFTSTTTTSVPSSNASAFITTTIISKHKKKKSNPAHWIDSSSGAMRIPTYTIVSRDNCALLRLAWEQEWQKVAIRCVTHPQETFCQTENSLRTPLHLATLNNVPCPIEVAQALLQTNRHMVLVQDKDRYTPLHNICFFRPSSSSSTLRRRRNGSVSHGSSRQAGTKSSSSAIIYPTASIFYSHCRQMVGEIEDNELIPLFCDTAIMVEQELQGHGIIPESMGISPLFLAAKRAAPLSTLQVLLQTRRQGTSQSSSSLSSLSNANCSLQHYPERPRRRARWIAPSTGGEPYWCATTLDEYSSPLEILLRDRASAVFGFLLDPLSDTKNKNNLSEIDEDEPGTTANSEQQRQRVLRILRKVAWHRLGTPPLGLRTQRTTSSTSNTRQGLTNEHSREDPKLSRDQNDSGDNTLSSLLSSTTKWQEDLQRLTVTECQAVLLWGKCLELLAEHCPRLLNPSHCGSPCPSTATFTATSNQVSSGRLLPGLVHTVACLKVPIPILFQLTLRVFPDQALLGDGERGMTPLHHVLEAQHPYATKTLLSILLDQEPAAAFVSFPRRLVDHNESSNSIMSTTTATTNKNDTERCENTKSGDQADTAQVYKDGLANLKSRNTCAGGQSPAIRALELNLPTDWVQLLLVSSTNYERSSKHKNDNHHHIFSEVVCDSNFDDKGNHHIYPNALEVADPVTGLFPFAVAACNGYDLTVVYSFLLASPQVLLYQCLPSL